MSKRKRHNNRALHRAVAMIEREAAPIHVLNAAIQSRLV